MTRLAEPMAMRVSRDGLLLRADPALMGLHLAAGGIEGGQLAVPALAALVRTASRLQMSLSRPVRVAMAEADVDLWVDAVPGAADVDLTVTSWSEYGRSSADESFEALARHHDVARFAEEGEVQVDSAMRILWLRSPLGDAAALVGSPLTQWVNLQADPDGTMPLLEAVAERQPFMRQSARLADDAMVLLGGRPLADRDGGFAGYLISVARQVASEGHQPTAAMPVGASLAPALRQPLGRIIANAETIGSRLKGPLRESYADYARDIASAARHLLELVEDIGDVEVVERPDFSTAADRIDLADCARRVAGLLRVRAAERHIMLLAPAEDVAIPATAEFRRVLQILVNLVGNAIRYSPDGTSVTIAAESDGDRARLFVADDGPGIPADAQDKIFDKFERLGRSGDGGSGLGLYISRRLARAMGGDITVESEPGSGTRFVLDLPV